MKMLIIEDDREIAEVIRIALEMRWPDATLENTHLGSEGIRAIEASSPDVVILDLGLPDASGYDVLKQIRAFSDVPVIILTARNEEIDITRGLELGADDYVTKPFRQMELLSRIRAVLRRVSPQAHERTLSFGPLSYNTEARQCYLSGKKLDLTRTEGTILEELLRHRGRVVSHARLAEAIWGEDSDDSPNNLRVYVRRLREKLETDPDNPQIIVTKIGVGYQLNRPD
jgi:two-component system response regulator VicR